MAALPNFLADSTLSPDQMKAVAALASGNSVLAAAQHTGVHRATIHNWLKLPDFRAALEQGRRDYASHTHAKLKEIADLAIDTLRQILTDPKASPSVKLRAALAVLDRPLFPQPVTAQPEEFEQFTTETPAPTPEIARNALCPCGSGNKYKRCCGTGAPPKLCHAA